MGRVTKACGPIEARDALQRVLLHRLKQRASPVDPIWILTSSSAHRRELLRWIPQWTGGAVLGLQVHTLHSAAHRILGSGPPWADKRPFHLWNLRRQAEEQPLLRRELGHLDDGFAAAARTQDEILQAGFFPEMLEVVEEVLQPLLHTRIGRRTLMLFQAATRTPGDSESIRNDSEFLERAADRVKLGSFSPPTTVVVGFMDATPGGTALIRELLRDRESHIILDFPADPTAQERIEPGVAFSAPFLQHLGIPLSPPSVASAHPHLHLFNASGDRGESCAIARKVRGLLDEGVAPESIGVVTRTEERLGWFLRLAFDEYGVPWSGQAVQHRELPLHRVFRGLIRLIREGIQTPVYTWAESAAFSNDALRRDVLLLLEQAGIAVLAQYPDTGFPLPSGILGTRETDIRASLRSLKTICRGFKTPGKKTSWNVHTSWACDLVEKALGWNRDGEPFIFLERALDLETDGSPELSRGEFAALLEKRIDGILPTPDTESRNGVRILDATKARGLTFSHVFVAKVLRNTFPRVISEDPLIPDSARVLLQAVLPDFRLRKQAHEEERLLFASLLASAPHVWLSWQRSSDEGKELGRSAFIDRLLLSHPHLDVEVIPRAALDAVFFRATRDPGIRTPFEHGIALGLLKEEDAWPGQMAQCFASNPKRIPEASAHLVRYRQAFREGYSPKPYTPEGKQARSALSPFGGAIGPVVQDDIRNRSWSVTALERYNSCPWQFWLDRGLGLRPIPSPTFAPQAIANNVVGNVVHDALESIFRDLLEASGSANPDDKPPELARPERDRIEKQVESAMRGVCVKAGIASPAQRNWVLTEARAIVHHALNLDWPDATSTVRVHGVETRGVASVPLEDGSMRDIRFRTDRLDWTPEGPRLIDYKTGKPAITVVTASKRPGKLLELLQSGKLLQGIAYSQSAKGAQGEYRYIRPEWDERVQTIVIDQDDTASQEVGLATLRRTFEGMEEGLFFPRLIEENTQTGRACGYCDFKTSCQHGDSEWRSRMMERAENLAEKEKLGALNRQEMLWLELHRRGKPLKEEE